MRFKFSLIVFFFSILSVHAQQFKWVKGGGTVYDFTSLPSRESEQTKYMCTDFDGNVYALSQVGNDPITADTFYRASGAFGANQNILLTSYNCNGQMRWAKLIASTAGDCIPLGVKTDSLGHVYVAGNLTNATLHIASDTSITGITYEAEGLMQFDTSGHFNWIRYVGDNTLSTLAGSSSAGSIIAIDGTNNAHYFVYMKYGVHITPLVTSIGGVYDLVYSPAGTLLSNIRLDMDSAWYLNGAVIDPTTNKLYVSGQINQFVYGGFLTDSFFAAAFDASRNLKWQYFCGHGDDDGLTGITIDPNKNLYFSGSVQPVSGPPTFSFNGDSVSAPFDDLSIIMKTDTNGKVSWIKHYDSHTSVNYFSDITLLPNYKVAATGTFAGTVTNGLVTLTVPTGEGQSSYVVIVDSAGDLQTMAQIYGDAGAISNAITSDRVGNMYVGGLIGDSVWAGTPAIPAYHSIGGNSDFFIMKFGLDCSCTSMPIASYTDTGHHIVDVTYTGTTTGLDSVVWNFGDGSATVEGITATHTYTATGVYRVCATAYTDCGNDIHCSDVAYQPALATVVSSMPDIKVYPNPANEELNITGVSMHTDYRMLSITGISVQQGSFEPGINTLSMRNFAPGIYILEMTGADGQRSIARVVKE